MNITISGKRVTVLVPYDLTISYLASGLEYAICWFMGSGIWRWRVLKTTSKEGVILDFQALVEPKSICAFSGVTSVSTLAEESYIPHEIHKEEIWTQEGQKRFSLTEGIAKTQRFNPSRGEFVFQTEELYGDTTLSAYAWGIGDTIVDCFLHGATEVKHQTSICLSQTWANIGLSDEEIEKVMNQPYDATKKVIVLK